ncbi:MAG: CoA-binding protein [Burkholderiales bacterium]|nr:CoA-binding protein [Burkholderiales bacterium]
MTAPDIPKLRRILADNRTIAVVGLSVNPSRPSHYVSRYMLDHGYQIIPVNPRYAGEEVLGQKCYASLREVPEPVGIVNCFRKSADIAPIAQEAIAIGAKVLWMQIGVINEEAERLALAAGLKVVVDRCIKIEYARLFGGLSFAGVDPKAISAKRPF